MKRLALAALLAVTPAFAVAAPPTTAQLDALMIAMDTQAGLGAMLTEMEAMSRRMAESMLPPDADASTRAEMDRASAASLGMVRELLDWSRLEPVYRQAYADVFTADEVEAMTRFYASPEGRAVLRKTPKVMGRVGEAMQPAMREAMKRVETALRRAAPPPAPVERH